MDLQVTKHQGHGTWSNLIVGSPQLRQCRIRIEHTPDGSIAFGFTESHTAGQDVSPGQTQTFIPMMWLGHTGLFYVANAVVGAGQAPEAGLLVTGDEVDMAIVGGRFRITRYRKDDEPRHFIFPTALPARFDDQTLHPALALSNIGDRVTFLQLPLPESAVGSSASVVRGGASILYRRAAAAQGAPLAWRNPSTGQEVSIESVTAAIDAAVGGRPLCLARAVLGCDESWPGLKRFHDDPRIYTADNFLSAEQCDRLVEMARPYLRRSAVVSTAAPGQSSSRRSSRTCYLGREECTWLLEKASLFLRQKPIVEMELPQVACYLETQRYDPHQDAFNMNESSGVYNARNGGQRLGTLLVYLNDVNKGGCTHFVHVGKRVQPKKGMAILFFPAFADGTIDLRMLHSGEPAIEEKWLCQIWIRQREFRGISSKASEIRAEKAKAMVAAGDTSQVGATRSIYNLNGDEQKDA